MGGLGLLEEVGGVARSGLGPPLLYTPRHSQGREQRVRTEGLPHARHRPVYQPSLQLESRCPLRLLCTHEETEATESQ